jgi:hypothetical protein
MHMIEGTVVNVFMTPAGQDKKTGETFGGGHKVQVQGLTELRNGESRYELLTLTTHDPEVFRSTIGKTVRIPVGAFAPAAGQIHYFMRAGARPEIVL